MLRTLFLLYICFSVSSTVKAQEETPPIIWLDTLTHDFGEIPIGLPAKTSFKFKNNALEVITIDNVRATCGCTSPNWEAEAIPPGANSEIKIVYDAKKTGYFRKKIKVYFSNIKKGYKLFIEGEVLE